MVHSSMGLPSSRSSAPSESSRRSAQYDFSLALGAIARSARPANTIMRQLSPGSQRPVHPNDHVHMGQSSNDTVPTAMHLAAYTMTADQTIPALASPRHPAQIPAVGRGGQDRPHSPGGGDPLTVGHEWSGYVGALDDAVGEMDRATRGLLDLAMGGTAVGTGLNAPAKPSAARSFVAAEPARSR